MALKSKSGKKGKTQEREKIRRKIGTLWESKKYKDSYNITVDDYHGDLIFQDKKTKKFYKVKAIALFDPHENAPQGAMNNLVIDLNNDYQTEVVGEDTSDDDTEEQDSEENDEEEA